MTAFEDVGFMTPKWSHRIMAFFSQCRQVRLIRTAIVTGKHNNGILGQLQSLQRGQDLPNTVILLHDEISISIQAAFALPLGTGAVGVCGDA